MARPNMKSVRLSNEALAIVESAEGSGFNDKFENLIFAYSNTIPDRLARLAAIDNQISAKKKELEALQALGNKVSFMVQQLGTIGNMLDSVTDVSQKVVQASTGIKHNEIQNYEQLAYTGNVHEDDFPEEEY